MGGWNNDQHGLVFKSSELKLYANSHTYAMKLSQLPRQTGILRIMTYSLPDMPYVREQLGRRPWDIWILCHSKFAMRAYQLKKENPTIRVATMDTMHSKVMLISPNTMYVGSENFGNSHWHETMIGVRSKQAHDWFIEYCFDPAWACATEIPYDTTMDNP